MPTIRIDFQEFMVMPVGAANFSEALRCGAEIFHALKSALHEAGLVDRASATRAASRPNIDSAREALDFILQAIESAGYRAGKDVLLALDPAASEFFKDGTYRAGRRREEPDARRRWSIISPRWSPIIRSPRSRTAWPRTTGRLEAADRAARRPASSWSATICSSPTSSGWRRGSPTASPIRS